MKRLPIWLGVAWLLAACMAALSAFDAHPDERFHVAAGAYYVDHWLPPRATEAELAPSLSLYGFTYLGEIDATDFLAGKVASLLPARIPQYLRFRAFNLLLFGILVVRVLAAPRAVRAVRAAAADATDLVRLLLLQQRRAAALPLAVAWRTSRSARARRCSPH